MGTIDAYAPPLFFVSYAHDFGQDDEHVRRFHADLSHDVRLFSGLRGEHVGFCDTSLRAGDLWSPALIEALRTCRVFLALCSPTYFSRPSCGKEWMIFTRRLAALPPGRRAGSISSLIPLFWVPMAMPEVAGAYQYRDRAFGEAYHEHGLRDLVRLSRNRDAYQPFVSALARRVLELARGATVPPYRAHPAFDAVHPAFGGPAAARSVERPPPPRVGGPSTVEMPALSRGGVRPLLNPHGSGATRGTDARRTDGGAQQRGVMEGEPQ